MKVRIGICIAAFVIRIVVMIVMVSKEQSRHKEAVMALVELGKKSEVAGKYLDALSFYELAKGASLKGGINLT